MKKILAVFLVITMAVAGVGGCGKKEEDKVIRIMAFSNELPDMVQKYLDMHPGLGYTMDVTIVDTANGAYQKALDEKLVSEAQAPDIYGLEVSSVLKYTRGEAAEYAASYESLGIDTAKKLKESKIASYASEIGIRESDGAVVALPYQATGGCFIYRRSIARATWGTDDPEYVSQIIGGGSGNWNQFWIAAENLKAKGYGIVSGDGDIWHVIENSSDTGWVVDGKLVIDPKREAFLDISKKLKENGYHNETTDWTNAWYADMKGAGEKKIFGFFGPTWLINYTLVENCGDNPETERREGTYGDWAVTESPVGFCWGGTYLASGKSAVEKMSDEKKQIVADILEWITLDYDENSLQYMWANGTFDSEKGTKDAVVSDAVMEKSDGSMAFLGGQDMFEYFVPAGDNAIGRTMTPYDETINAIWRDAVRAYVAGTVDRDGAIARFKAAVKSRLGLEAE